MKKGIVILLTIILMFIGVTVFADNGNVVGKIYSTDILAFVNQKPIESYNIGGRTVVIAEELDNYGFRCTYYDETRTLNIIAYFYELGNDIKYVDVPRGKIGKIVGNIYETDIKVFLNGHEIKGYNIGGKTAICLEDMGNLTGSPNAHYGYSKYLGKSVWNENDRTIFFETFMRNDNKVMGKLARVCYNFLDNVLYAYPDEWSTGLEIRPTSENPDFTEQTQDNYSEVFEKDIIAPLYLNVKGNKKQVGLAILNPNNENETLLNFFDIKETLELTAQAKLPQKSYNDAMEYFLGKYEIVNQLDNDDYTVLHINDSTDGVLFVYINKSGGCVIDDFLKDYKDRDVKIWFKEDEKNVISHSVYPFAGPHGATTMQYYSELGKYDYK